MYALLNMPVHNGCVNCGECCGVIPANKAEIQEIRQYLKRKPEVRALAIKQSGRPLDCPFRDEKNRCCVIYPIRPMVCRLCGVSKGMQCAHGNSMEIDGRKFLNDHHIDDMQILNLLNWEK